MIAHYWAKSLFPHFFYYPSTQTQTYTHSQIHSHTSIHLALFSLRSKESQNHTSVLTVNAFLNRMEESPFKKFHILRSYCPCVGRNPLLRLIWTFLHTGLHLSGEAGWEALKWGVTEVLQETMRWELWGRSRRQWGVVWGAPLQPLEKGFGRDYPKPLQQCGSHPLRPSTGKVGCWEEKRVGRAPGRLQQRGNLQERVPKPCGMRSRTRFLSESLIPKNVVRKRADEEL